MDLLAEDLIQTDYGFKITDDLIIPILLWVDDVISIAEGKLNQRYILEEINQFAIKHRIKWGQNKCNVMLVGKHERDANEEPWKVGDMIIEETDRYRFLGGVISNDGKNTENKKTRKTK